MEQLRAYRPLTQGQVDERRRARLVLALRAAARAAAISAVVFLAALAVVRAIDVQSRASAMGAALVLLVAGVVTLGLLTRAAVRIVAATRTAEEDRFADQQAIADLAPFASALPEIAVIMSDWMVIERLRMREIHMLRLSWNLWRVERGAPAMLAGVDFENLDPDA